MKLNEGIHSALVLRPRQTQSPIKDEGKGVKGLNKTAKKSESEDTICRYGENNVKSVSKDKANGSKSSES